MIEEILRPLQKLIKETEGKEINEQIIINARIACEIAKRPICGFMSESTESIIRHALDLEYMGNHTHLTQIIEVCEELGFNDLVDDYSELLTH